MRTPVRQALLRLSEEFPTPLVPGQTCRVKIRLCGIADAFPPGHRVRVALATSYLSNGS